MRPLRYSINISIDGCCDHRAMMPDAQTHAHATQTIADADAIILGRTTYQMMEDAWRPSGTPSEMADWTEPFARTIDAARKYVVSSQLSSVDWNAELLPSNFIAAIAQLKTEPGNGLYVGGVQLPLALADAGLIDEYEFLVYPTIAGHGPRPFDGLRENLDLKFVGRKDFESGVVALRYKI